MTATAAVTVFSFDDKTADRLSATGVRVLRRFYKARSGSKRNVFVVTSASNLPRASKFAKSIRRAHELRGILVACDVPVDLLALMMERSGIRSFRNVLVHSEPDVLDRVLRAWQMGAQDQLIADAHVIDGRLVLRSCALDTYEVSFEDIPALGNVGEDAKFEIDLDGSFVYWPDADVHLDLDAIRYASDPTARARLKATTATGKERFGAAVRSLREKHGLRQSDIKNLDERQVRRIETGRTPRISTLEKLAAAHEMDLDSYLDELARVSSQGAAENVFPP